MGSRSLASSSRPLETPQHPEACLSRHIALIKHQLRQIRSALALAQAFGVAEIGSPLGRTQRRESAAGHSPRLLTGARPQAYPARSDLRVRQSLVPALWWGGSRRLRRRARFHPPDPKVPTTPWPSESMRHPLRSRRGPRVGVRSTTSWSCTRCTRWRHSASFRSSRTLARPPPSRGAW